VQPISPKRGIELHSVVAGPRCASLLAAVEKTACDYCRKSQSPDNLAESTGNVIFGQLVFRISENRLGVIHLYQSPEVKIGRAL
jgi:hypothetical protein